MKKIGFAFHPKLLDCFKNYNRSAFFSDICAGISVGILALPLAMAFAIASGVTPEQGLYTAIVAGFIIAVFGGSRVQIGGPTGAFIVIVAGIIAQYGYAALAVATVMAGVFLVINKNGQRNKIYSAPCYSWIYKRHSRSNNVNAT